MNRVCLTKDGKLIEMQSGGESDDKVLESMRLCTLKQNALNAGYKEDEIEVKWVTEEEWTVIQEANKPILTYADLRRLEYDPVGDQLDNITESLKFLMESGVKIGEFGEAQVKM